MEALLADKDEEIANLLSENRILNLELNQCKSDKDFVWSLWQQLQEQRPDVTEAVSCVMHREKAINEEKDRKVMDILNTKDCEIRHLKNEIQILKVTKKQLSSNNHNLDSTFQRQINENEDLRRELEHHHMVDHTDHRPITCATAAGSTKCDSIHRLLNQERSNTDFMAKMATLDSRMSATTVDMQRYMLDNSDIRSQLKEVKIAKSEKSQQLQCLANERDQFRKDNANLKKELFHLDKKCQELECDLAEKKKCTRRMKDKLDECQEEIQRQSELLRQLEKARHEAERISRENEEKHTNLENDLRRKYESTRRDSAKLKNDLDCEHQSFEEKLREVSVCQAQLQSERNRYEDDLCNLKGILQDADNKTQEILCDRNRLEDELRRLKGILQDTENKAQEILCERNRLEDDLRNLKGRLHDADIKAQDLLCERNRLEDDLCKARGKLQDADNKTQDLQGEKEDLNCQILQLEQEFHERLECREREFKRELSQREECFRRDLCAQEQRLRDDFHREIDCEREKFDRDSQEKDHRHQHILEDKRTQFARRLHSQEQEFCSKIATTEEEYKRQQNCLEQDLQRNLNSQEEEFQRQLCHHHEESKKQLERQKDHFEQQIREKADESEDKLDALERKYCTQVKFLEEKAIKLDEDFKKTLKAQEKYFEKAFQEQEEKFRCEKAEFEHNLCRARNRLSAVEAEYKRRPYKTSRSCTPPKKSKKKGCEPPRLIRRRSISPPFDDPYCNTSPSHIRAESPPLYGTTQPPRCSSSPPPPCPTSPRFTSPSSTLYNSPPHRPFYHPPDYLLTNCETTSLDRFITSSTPRGTPPKKRGRKTYKRSKSAGRSVYSESFSLNRSSRSLSPMCRFYSNSFSPNKEILTLRKRVNTLETKIDCMKILLQLKQEEMDNLSCAHDRRMLRLQNLQKDFKKMIKHCSDNCSKQTRKNNNYNRCLNDTGGCDDTLPDGMYNELACLKQKNKILSTEKLALEDDIDRFYVQRASDKATIQQLLLGFKPAKNKHCKPKPKPKVRRAPAQAGSSLCWMPNPSCGYQRERPTVPVYNNRHMTSKLKSLQLRYDNSLRDIDFLQNEKMELQKETGLMRDEIKSLRRDVIDARSKETRLRDECDKLRDDVSKCEYTKDELKKENEKLQQDIEQARDDNINKRWEIGNLRSDAIKLRGEIKELKREITKYSNKKNTNIRKGEIPTSTVNKIRIIRKKPQRYFVSSKRSKSARQHQKFLNKSVMKMKRMFGNNFNADQQYDSLTSTTTTQQNDTTTTTQQKSSSDTSSLGQAIVCSARNKVGDDVTLVDDESEEYVDDDDTDDVITSDKTNSTISRSIQTKRSSSSVAFDVKKQQRVVNPGMVAALRHRLAALQKQYNNLKSAKISQHDKVIVEKNKNEELTKEVESYQNKLKSCKQNLSRLHREIEILKKSKQELETKYEEEKMSKSQRYSDADYKYIEAKLKTANHDNVKIATELQQQKDETDKKSNQISIDNDKISRLERDVQMKRQLIDDLRVKVKNHDEKLEKEQEKTREATNRLRTLETEIGHKKSNIEALRRQVQVATKEKHDYETMLRQSKTEINRQGEAMEKLKLGKSQAEASTDKLAEEAQLQLTTLASRSEEAIDRLNSKLERSDRKLREFVTMTTVLSGRLLEYASSLRNAIYDVKVQALKEKSKTSAARKGKEKKMSSNAQRIACQILDISGKDFQDLMAPVHEDSADEEQIERNLRVRIEAQESDHTWKEEVEKMTNKNMSPPFAKLLSRLLWQKMDECLQMTREKSELTAENLPSKQSK